MTKDGKEKKSIHERKPFNWWRKKNNNQRLK